ncbi:MAG TPA: thioesterase family protein [Solirubrobacteraceae bacterium]|nr:thioesterase family protein [Solirubrobacteraceae bacterium]
MGEPLSYPLRVRYAECDMQGVVFNANYLAYFDVSMTELWRAAFGGYEAMLDRGVDLVVVDARLSFRFSARFDDELTMEIAVARFGTTSIATRHRVLRDGEVLVEGAMAHVFVTREDLAKTPIPAWARDGLAPWAI